MKNGYILTTGKNIYFLETECKNKSKKVIDAFITCFLRKRDLWEDREKYLNNASLREDIARHIDKAIYELKDTGKVVYHSISGKNFGMSFPLDDCDELHFIQ